MKYDLGWHYVGEEGEPAFENGCDNVAGVASNVRFMKGADGVVRIEGGFNSSPQDFGQSIFTLPEGYRPEYQITLVYDFSGSPYRCIIMPDGRVLPYKNVGNCVLSFFVGPVLGLVISE